MMTEIGRINRLPEVTRGDHRPMYVQVAACIETAIREGRFQPGEQLPGQLQMCERYHISRWVIDRATKRLVAAGLVRAEHGRGLFVAGGGEPRNG